MVRFFVAAILVFSLSGCAADDVEVAAVDASILMSTGEEVVQLRADEYGNGLVGAYNRKGKGRTLKPGPK